MSLRIVITTTLNDNLFYAKLVPLVRSRPDVELVVVSDREGPAFERVKWVWPRGIVSKLGRLGGRLPLLAREVLHPRTKLVMAYSLVPHGMFAVSLAKLRGLPVYLHFIAGAAEVSFAHNPKISHNRVIFNSRNPEKIEQWANRFAKRADRIFVPGHSTSAFLKNHGFSPDRIVHLHSTVDLTRYSPSPEPRDIDVVVVAQILENKRPLYTLDVLAEVRRRVPHARFCWLGDGPMRDQFAAHLRTLGLEECMTWTHTNDVAAYYRRSKIFLLCSMSEGLSLGCMEAMGCGVVPVTSDVGDMQDVVIPGRTGYPVAVDSPPEAYAAPITELLSNAALLDKYSQESHNLIISEHSFESAQRFWDKLLNELT